MVARGRRDDGAQLHALGDEARMVVFLHLARGQSDLVAVGGIALRGGRGDAALRELALAGAGVRHARIAGAGDAHRLIDVAAAGERVADRAAQAGGRTAEGLNFCGMIMSFILKKKKPRLILTVDIYIDFYRTRIDFFRFIKLCKLAVLFKIFNGNSCYIHKANRLL